MNTVEKEEIDDPGEGSNQTDCVDVTMLIKLSRI